MKKITILLFTTFLLFAISQACKGPQGDVGPQGVPGVQGEKGAQGPIGTANIIYSEWIKLNFVKQASAQWVANISAPKITQEILDKGLIKVYFKLDKTILEVPVSLGETSVFQQITLGKITLYSSIDWSNSWSWRYIIIPGGIGAKQGNIDYSDYEAVKKAYNIPD